MKDPTSIVLADVDTFVTLHKSNIETILNTKTKVDSKLSRTFEDFLLKLAEIKQLDDLSIDIEDIQYSSDYSNKISWHKVKMKTYLGDIFFTLSKDISENLISIIDERLQCDLTGLLETKKRIVEQLYNTRDSSALYRRLLETSMNEKLSDSVRFIKNEFEQTLLKENVEMSKNLQESQALYDTLWIVHEGNTEQLISCEETILQLNESALTSFETISNLRENMTIMRERHEDYVEKVRLRNEALRRHSLIVKQNLSLGFPGQQQPVAVDQKAINQAILLFQASVEHDVSDDESVDLHLERVCKECLTFRVQMEELKVALVLVRRSLDIVNQQNKRMKAKAKTMQKGKKNSKIPKGVLYVKAIDRSKTNDDASDSDDSKATNSRSASSSNRNFMSRTMSRIGSTDSRLADSAYNTRNSSNYEGGYMDSRNSEKKNVRRKSIGFGSSMNTMRGIMVILVCANDSFDCFTHFCFSL